jgi:hypothetical protein
MKHLLDNLMDRRAHIRYHALLMATLAGGYITLAALFALVLAQ